MPVQVQIQAQLSHSDFVVLSELMLHSCHEESERNMCNKDILDQFKLISYGGLKLSPNTSLN